MCLLKDASVCTEMKMFHRCYPFVSVSVNRYLLNTPRRNIVSSKAVFLYSRRASLPVEKQCLR